MIEQMREFYKSNSDFKDYVDKCMQTYQKDITDILISPITQEYYKMLIKNNSGKEGKE